MPCVTCKHEWGIGEEENQGAKPYRRLRITIHGEKHFGYQSEEMGQLEEMARERTRWMGVDMTTGL